MSDIKIRRNNHDGESQKTHAICPNCGAPILSEVCQYCGSYVGQVATKDLSAEYEVLQAHNAKLTFFGTVFPMIFAFMFSFVGFGMPILFTNQIESSKFTNLFFVPFMAIGIGAMFFFVRSVMRFMRVTFWGKDIEGTVYGYMDDTIAYNGINGQIVKLLIQTKDGPKFIFLKTHGTNKPYPVNKKVPLRVHGNCFLVQNPNF